MRTYDEEPPGLAEIKAYLASHQAGASSDRFHLSGSGAVAELEKKIAGHYGAKHAVVVSSATAGLLVLALALDLKNSEFITSPVTFGGGLAPLLLLGNRPVFADVEDGSFTLDPESVRRTATEVTKAVLAVDIFGNPSDTIGLRKAASEIGAWYIADSAQAFGARRSGHAASRFADAIVISFNAQKPIGFGEGGAIITDDRDIYKRIIWSSQHADRQKKELGIGVFNEFAYNARPHPLGVIWANANLTASLTRTRKEQIDRVDAIKGLTRAGLIYKTALSKRGTLPSFFSFPIQPAARVAAETIQEWLRTYGCPAEIVPLPAGVIYNDPMFRAQYRRRFSVPAPCPVSEGITRFVGLKFLEV